MTERVQIPDTPGYLVIVGDDRKEWARKAVTITWRLNPETRVTSVRADFAPFDVKPPLKKRERRGFRLEYRDMADTLLIAGDWQGRWHPLGRKDTVRVSPDGGVVA